MIADFTTEITTFVLKKKEECLYIAKENLLTLLGIAKKRGFFLIDLSAIDYSGQRNYTEVLYFLMDPKTNARIIVSVEVERDESLPSVRELFLGSLWYERELFDLFGVSFEGHKDLTRILMPDDYEGHPLRKDFSLKEERVEFKNGVVVKTPSELIPHVKATPRKY